MKSTVADIKNWQAYKSKIDQDIRKMPQDEKVTTRWISTHRFDGETKDRSLVLIGDLHTDIASQWPKLKKTKSGDSLRRVSDKEWETDDESLFTALGKLNFKGIQKVDTLETKTVKVPAWHAPWKQGQAEIMTAVQGQRAPLDDLPTLAKKELSSRLSKADDSNVAKLLQEVRTALVKAIKARLIQVAKDTAATFDKLEQPLRDAAVKSATGQVNAVNDLKDLIKLGGDLAAGLSWSLEEKLQAKMKTEFDALELQRRPTREEWAKFLKIGKNDYKVIKSAQVFKFDGVDHATHYTISDDSVTASRPKVHGVPAAQVLKEAWIDGVRLGAQSHATIEFPSAADNLHLYLGSKSMDPKDLTEEQAKVAEEVLKKVRVELVQWLNTQITAFQKTLK